MSIEFALRRISTELVKTLQDFGEPAFDLFWASDLIDDDDLWTEDKIQEYFFSDGKSFFQDFPRDLMLPILIEGCEISRSLDKSFSTDGAFVECIHFLLAGKRQFHQHDFIVKEVSFPDDRTLTLINVLVGMHEIKEEADFYASYLTAIEVEAVVKFLPKIFNDKFDMRWKMLQELEQGSEYFQPYHEDPQRTEEMIDSIKRWRHSCEERLHRSFSESFFHPEEPRQFIQDELFPFLVKASQLGCGVLASRAH